MAKLEAGKLPLERIAYSPAEVVQATLQLHAPQTMQKSIRLTNSVDVASTRVMGDPFRLQQVLNNLLSNAIKFTPDSGSVCLEVRERQGRLRFAVRDTGPGLAPAAQTLLFQPFAQADSSMARRFGGTGLGLTISRQLVELMGGSIGLFSKEGGGSEFWFEIPCEAAPENMDSAALMAEPKVFGAHVLIAEDNHVNQRILCSVLDKLGCTFELVEHGGDAVKVVQNRQFDLILMDCHMPEMDGFAAAQSIRALATAVSATPIIAVTAAAFEDDARRARDAGMDDFLSKPFTREQLSEILTRWVGRTRG